SSAMEYAPPDRGDVGEEPDAEDDDHPGRELSADAELVAEVDDGGRDHDVGEEGDDEDLVVEDPFQGGAEGAAHGVEGGDDGDREVGVESRRDVRREDQAEDDAREKSQ